MKTEGSNTVSHSMLICRHLPGILLTHCTTEALWCELSVKLDNDSPTGEPWFDEWNRKVLTLLRPPEVERFNKPLPSSSLGDDAETRSGSPAARVFHLTIILWQRQGLYSAEQR